MTEADCYGAQLRDEFAKAALTGLLADPSVPVHDTAHVIWVADRVYTLADAMLARRSQPTGAPAPQPGVGDTTPTKGQ